jgi:membrane-associated phospholipid phosphatase
MPLICCLLTSASAFGQSRDATEPQPATQSERPASARGKSFLKDFLRDERDIWTAPLKKKGYSSRALKKYVIPFALLSGTLIATDQKSSALLPNTSDQRKWSGRISQIGASYTLVSVSGGTYLLGKVTKNKHAEETGRLALNAFAHTQVVTFAIKELTNRARPPNEARRAGFWKGGNSFPSGHASTTFAVATVFAYEYREHIAVPILSYSVASVVSASRVSAQRHWVSDIVVGGSTGFLIGRHIFKRHHDPVFSEADPPLNHLLPDVAVSTNSVSMEWQF